MVNTSAFGEAVVEVIAPDGSRRMVPLNESPFYIGRGEVENHLPIPDPRISRKCAAISYEGGRYYIEDRGHRLGIFVNRKRTSRRVLQENDSISFGLADVFQLVFRTSAPDAGIESILTRIGANTRQHSPADLGKLNLLLEATMLLHSQLPLEAVLGAMLDRAIIFTKADRGLLLEVDESGGLRQRLARRAGTGDIPAVDIPMGAFSPSQTALRLAIERQAAVITEDLPLADMALQAAQSIIAQRLRVVVAIPLFAMARAGSGESAGQVKRGNLLGVLYLDSRSPKAFSTLDRKILDALAIEAASILDNARLVERERQRERMEQELAIAREIQQALLPRGFSDFSHVAVSGINSPCHAVGGDYFDVFNMSEDRTAFVIADVSGKGLGAALLTPMLQGALTGMTLDTDPVRVFHHINTFLCEHSSVGRYATLFFGIIDREGHLQYLTAGHPSPLLLRDGVVSELYTEGSFPIGLIPEATYTISHANLGPGDTLVLFSDGVTEAEDASQELFGTARLSDVLAGQQNTPLDQIQQKVVDAVNSFAAGVDQADDLTVLLVRRRATSLH